MRSIQCEASAHHSTGVVIPPARVSSGDSLAALSEFPCIIPNISHPTSYLPSLEAVLLAAPLSVIPNGVGIMKVLTPDALTPIARSLRLLRSAFPTFRPQPRNPSPSRFVSRLSARGYSRLRHAIAGSPRDPAESGSSSYGLSLHLQLLPTPPHGDAVTFDYWATTHPGADFHRANRASSRTHDCFAALAMTGRRRPPLILPGGKGQISPLLSRSASARSAADIGSEIGWRRSSDK